MEYRESICAGGSGVFAIFDGFSYHCCGENFSVDIQASFMGAAKENSSVGVLGVRCGSGELFGEISGYFSFVRDDLTREGNWLIGVLQTAFSS